ncbi:MAG: hypothetical protein R3E79_28300 [Caldilineaceae bacterium]
MSRFLRTLLLVSLLFLALWLPRTLALDAFATADEHDWLTFSANFYQALRQDNPEQTFQIEHPGVSVMAAGALAFIQHLPPSATFPAGGFSRLEDELEQWLSANTTVQPLTLLATGRWWLTLWSALALVIAFFPLRRLWGVGPAAGALLLVGWDPFLLGLSRQLHPDAFLPSLTLLALALFLGWLYGNGVRVPGTGQIQFSILRHPPARPRHTGILPLFQSAWRWYYLVGSGLVMGLAWLTKIPAVVLGPTGLLLVGVELWRQRRDKAATLIFPRAFLAIALWGLLAVVTTVALWPALWGDAFGILLRIVNEMRSYAGGHVNPNFFNGQVVDDPGPLFYPTVLLWRATPATLIGCLLLLWPALWRSDLLQRAPVRRSVISLLLFALLFLGLMTAGAKKFERYLAPALAALDLAAALGWVGLWQMSYSYFRFPGLKTKVLPTAVTGLIVVTVLLHGALSAWCYPYYLTYYNPLVGGARTAPRLLMIGWGEGLDAAARWLNQQPDAAQLRAVAWYPYGSFSYFFAGETGKWTYLAPLAWLDTDYVVIYANQWQRGLPSADVVKHFLAHEPVHVVWANGLELARIYDMRDTLLPDFVALDHAQAADFGGQVRLAAYAIPSRTVQPGDTVPVTLYLQGVAPISRNYNRVLRLIDVTGQEVWRADGWPWNAPTQDWPIRTIRPDSHTMAIPQDLAPGLYKLTLGFYDPVTFDPLPVTPPNQPVAADGATEHAVSLLQVGAPPSPAGATSAWRFGDAITLTSVGLPAAVQPGATLPVTLRWQTAAPVDSDYTVFVHVVSADGTLVAQQDRPPLDGFAPTSLWQPTIPVVDTYQIPLPTDLPVGGLALRVGLYTMEHGRLPVQGQDAPVGDFAAVGTVRVVVAD